MPQIILEILLKFRKNGWFQMGKDNTGQYAINRMILYATDNIFSFWTKFEVDEKVYIRV